MTCKLQDLSEKVRAYYSKPGNGAGGNLHIVLDDGNLEDSHIIFCIKCAEERDDLDGIELGKEILQLSKTQRKKLYRRSMS